MLLSAVSVLVVAQSSSEIPEGLMNNPVYNAKYDKNYANFKVRDETAIKFLTSIINTFTLERRFEILGSHVYVTRLLKNRTLINSEF